MFSNIGVEFSVLMGKTITSVDINKQKDVVIFRCSNGTGYIMQHYQDCCENVYLEDVAGNFEDILNQPILLAEEVSNQAENENGYESVTWTFYKLVTNLGAVTLRWFGGSNGYYSEDVAFALLED